jgi:hypothetical protein
MKKKPHQGASASKVVPAIGAIFAAMSIVFVVIGVRLIQLEQVYDAESTIVDGIVASKRVDEKNGIDRETKLPIVTRTYFLKLGFLSDQGRDIEVETTVSKDRWDSFQERAPIKVQYLPNNPVKSRIAGDSEKLKAYLFTGLGAVGALSGLFLLFKSIGRAERR